MGDDQELWEEFLLLSDQLKESPQKDEMKKLSKRIRDVSEQLDNFREKKKLIVRCFMLDIAERVMNDFQMTHIAETKDMISKAHFPIEHSDPLILPSYLNEYMDNLGEEEVKNFLRFFLLEGEDYFSKLYHDELSELSKRLLDDLSKSERRNQRLS